MKKLILTFATALAVTVVALPAAQAACKVSDKLVHDVVMQDLVGYALGSDSLSERVVSKMGYDSYAEYMYGEESYSKGLAEMIDDARSIGGKFTNAIYKSMEHTDAQIEKAEEKFREECSDEELTAKFLPSLVKALDGKDLKVEIELMQLHMKGLIGAL